MELFRTSILIWSPYSWLTLGSLEVEDGICKQIEEKIWDLTGIKEMTSYSREMEESL